MSDEEQEAREAAARIGIALPDECVPGVIENLRLLARHAALLGDAPDETGAA
jgi:hypothetical protein